MIRICRQCRRSRRPIQLESRGAPEKLLAFRRFEWPDTCSETPRCDKDPNFYYDYVALLSTMCRPRMARFFLNLMDSMEFSPSKAAFLRIFSRWIPNLWWSKMSRTAFENFLRQNQHFFSQKQTKILLELAPWGLFIWQFSFPLWSCKFRLKVVLGGKGSTWRGGTVVETTTKTAEGRGKTCYKSHQEWGNFPIGVEVKNPRILRNG